MTEPNLAMFREASWKRARY